MISKRSTQITHGKISPSLLPLLLRESQATQERAGQPKHPIKPQMQLKMRQEQIVKNRKKPQPKMQKLPD